MALTAILASAPAAAAPPAAKGWLDDLSAARERAEREGKPLLVDLWADWCTWCKRLDQEVFSTPLFREYAQGFVLLRVDTEDAASGARLMEDFEVESLPTTLLLTDDLIKIGEVRGFAPVERYVLSLQLEAAMFATLLHAYDDHRSGKSGASPAGGGDGHPAARDAGDGGPGTDALQTLADELHARRDGARAAILYRHLLERGAENVVEDAWNRYYYADSLRLGREWSQARDAIASARAAAAKIEDDELRERIDLLPYHLARDTGACSAAREALEQFLLEHSEGIFAENASAALRRIESTGRCT
ncbi:MAG TPA: thioredoxin family protein [Thermoanaerobaculia bacterium]|nr:thioredoxin family protein [Thermoanaerobaculia bacterium]